MTIPFRMIALCLSTGLFFMQFMPIALQAQSPSSAQSDLTFDAIADIERDNGLSLARIESPLFDQSAIAINWSYNRGLQTEQAGLADAHMRCVVKLFEKNVQKTTLNWDSLGIQATEHTVSFAPPNARVAEVISALAATVVSFEPDAADWSDLRSEMETELETHGALSGTDPMEQIMDQILFSAKHPYGEVPDSTSLSAIELNDIIEFHRRYFRPNNCRIVFCSAPEVADENSADQWASEFDEWTSRSVPASSISRPAVSRSTQVAWIESDERKFATFRAGHVMRLKPGDSEAWVLRTAAAILEQRLNDGLAEDENVSVHFKSDANTGQFIAQGVLHHSTLANRMSQLQEELQRMTDDLVTEVELNTAKQQVSLDHHSNASDARWIATHAAKGTESLMSWSTASVQRSLDNASANEIRRVANNRLRPRNLNFLGNGPKGVGLDLGTALDSDGNIDWYDDAGNLIEPYVPVPGLEAASVFNAYYEACGGAKAFETTKSSRAVTRMDAEGGTVYTITTESLYGTGFVASYEANGQVMMENVVTIEDGFKRQMGINQKMSTSEYDRLRPQIYLDRLLHLSELQGTAEVLGSYATNGTSQYVVRINYADGSEETLFFDSVSSKLIAAAVKRSSSRGVNTTHYAFDQYQLYDGLAFPTVITQTTNGRSIQFITEAMDLNIRISPDTFKRY